MRKTMGLAFLVLAMFGADNEVFWKTVAKQAKDGYEWHYVGKTKPSGVPAITIKPENGDEYILWKLKK